MMLPGTLFRRPDGAIVHVELPEMPDAVAFEGRTFDRKSEFHVTLLGREILARAGVIDFPTLEQAMRRAARKVRFSVEFLDDFWFVVEGDAATIIRMCKVKGAEEFYRRFEEASGFRIDRPPYHVTLYASGTRKGIGIATAADLETRGRLLTPAEIAELTRIIT